MKTSIRQYATALIEMTEGKSKDEIKKIIKNFLKILIGNNDLKKTQNIIDEFVSLYNKKNKIIEAEVRSVRPLDANSQKLIREYIEKITAAEKVELTNPVDKSLLGGVVIKYEDRVLDNSLRTKIDDLKNVMKK